MTPRKKTRERKERKKRKEKKERKREKKRERKKKKYLIFLFEHEDVGDLSKGESELNDVCFVDA